MASGCGEVVAGPRRTLCFWLQLVEILSMCFPVFIEPRARNAAYGHGGRPAGAWLPGLAQTSVSEQKQGQTGAGYGWLPAAEDCPGAQCPVG